MKDSRDKPVHLNMTGINQCIINRDLSEKRSTVGAIIADMYLKSTMPTMRHGGEASCFGTAFLLSGHDD